MNWEEYIQKRYLNIKGMEEWLTVLNHFRGCLESKGFFDYTDHRNLMEKGSDFVTIQNIVGILMNDDIVYVVLTDESGIPVDIKTAYEHLVKVLEKKDAESFVKDYIQWLENFSAKWLLN